MILSIGTDISEQTVTADLFGVNTVCYVISHFGQVGPVVQSIVSLQLQKLLTFFQQNISIYAIFHYQSVNDMLINNIVSFEQLGPGSEMDKI